MAEDEELVDYLTRKKLDGIKFRYNFSIITNVILICVFVIIGVYIYFNLEEFKQLGSDVCRLCETKTGGVCLASGYNNTMAANETYTSPWASLVLNITS